MSESVKFRAEVETRFIGDPDQSILTLLEGQLEVGDTAIAIIFPASKCREKKLARCTVLSRTAEGVACSIPDLSNGRGIEVWDSLYSEISKLAREAQLQFRGKAI